MRSDGRAAGELRQVRISPGFLSYAEGSALIELGKTWVLCAASVEETQPPHLMGTDTGWITAEYAMLPRATHTRSARESVRGRLGGRTMEIQRLIGRVLRASTNLRALGPRTIIVDCDVLQADGGTRTAAITGGYVALALALRGLVERGLLRSTPLVTAVAATSVGIVKGEACLDLSYAEDSRAEVDFNVAMTSAGEFVEIQGTGEGRTFGREAMLRLLNIATNGIEQLFVLQEDAMSRAMSR